jgi:hypothetical protein
VDEVESRSNYSVIEDANVVAFLMMKGYVAIPFIQTTKQVAWEVQGDEKAIDTEIRMFQSNERIGIRDYVIILKDIRSQMYLIKQLHNQLKKGD